ncbi:RNA-binding S4 domain-containing protein [Rhodopirellula sp. JC740]|uniref:RNA-binding S4 domain-containing protein n=1 Tax=Rhodopirellula halodulae TaxID=2894198 RepID=A0ABS8NEF6_9BACT|nr:RNA-binding S4 domain-containing protein [Rhodopirellula sp. JC740]MCC9640856.1 RNA-binding S4 domain-containing protein [Rhodopirellula sp. JC740]
MSEPTSSQPDDRPMVRLDDFLKREGLVGTGGEAKVLIQSGAVMLNGKVDTRRRKQLHDGDVVTFEGEDYVVDIQSLGDPPM